MLLEVLRISTLVLASVLTRIHSLFLTDYQNLAAFIVMLRATKFGLFLLCCLLLGQSALAQSEGVVALRRQLDEIRKEPGFQKDTAYARTLTSLAFFYADSYPDSAILLLKGLEGICKNNDDRRGEALLYKVTGNALQTKGEFDEALDYYQKAYELAEENEFNDLQPGILNNRGLIFLNRGDYPRALETFYTTLEKAAAIGDSFVLGRTQNNIGTVLFYQDRMQEAEASYRKMLSIAERMRDTSGIILAYNNIAEVNVELHQPDSAIRNLNTTRVLAIRNHAANYVVSASNSLGEVYLQMDSAARAYATFSEANELAGEQNNAKALVKAKIGMTNALLKLGRPDSALLVGRQALQLSLEMGQIQLIRDANEVLATVEESRGQDAAALGYYKAFKAYSDSLSNIETEKIVANYRREKELIEQEQQFRQRTARQRWLSISFAAGIVFLIIIIAQIIRGRRRLSHKNAILEQQNELIRNQKTEAESTLTTLRQTQKQLIQAEKMASLGELTAGIAHEIRNPLNFVNNFSELNMELIEEMKTALKNADYEDVQAIAEDLAANEEKVVVHGKRADAIVTSMLQHSRQTTGHKELVELNALCDEYLRLSYHGIRARDKSFQSDFKTIFDPSAGKVSVVPQDLGRVLLNLLNNAFYAVNEKRKQGLTGYEPVVILETCRQEDRVMILVRDNGDGIADVNKEKIFQPFFTTKPTGSGTGLGLSLSFDIIRAHGGELTCESAKGEGTVFTITPPRVNNWQTMSTISIILIIFINELRKKYLKGDGSPQLRKKLMGLLYAAIATVIMEWTVPELRSVTPWMNLGLLLGFLSLLRREKQLAGERYLVVALIPLGVVVSIRTLVRLLAPSFYNEWNTWFEAASTFAFIWAIGTWLVSRRQQKELKVARQKAVDEERNSQIATRMKAQLEVQVAERTAELQKQKDQLELALEELKAAQAQLVHSEKMASLGELTAGIAHEIQNPLNFVNNFSDVSAELLDEMNAEIDAGNMDEVRELASDVKQNLEKILFHGKRADGIVKGMLQHSRGSSGQKELTNINALCDEYLRLSYHGLRAKNKSFNADFETIFDENAGEIMVVPQDMGRVILNLINNAFYAVTEKAAKAPADYRPMVKVGTKREGNELRIWVYDNGIGITDEVREKIFQPFFTTKPTGQGTGLGLSLSFDIVRAHGGELKLESQAGEYTRFIIFLPLHSS